jgi:cytochrome c oxidase subunit 3
MRSPAARPRHASQFDNAAQQQQAGTFGLWIFLATELMFFGPLFFGYVYGRTHEAAGFAQASRHTDVVLGTINTAVLLTSSLAMAAAVEARNTGATKLAQWLLLLTAVLGIFFLAIKGVEYRNEWREHLFPGAAFSFQDEYARAVEYFFFLYFVMTGLHALHLAIGIGIVCVYAWKLRASSTAFASGEHMELAGLYWHFVDSVWIFLYPILYLVGRSAA